MSARHDDTPISPTFVFQTSRPDSAFTAMVRLSSVLKKILPFEYAAPRFTESQHATPMAAASGFGL